MKHPESIIANHIQKYECSCAAWGLEMIALMHEIPLNPLTPFQDACKMGCGFEDTFIHSLNQYGIKTRTAQYRENLGQFERDALAAIAKNEFPVVTLPSGLVPDKTTGAFKIITHTFIVTEDKGQLVYITTEYGKGQVVRVPMAAVANSHDLMVRSPLLVVSHENLVNALFHSESGQP